MKRKVSQIGPATLMVSLPSKWVKRCGVKKGDELDVEEKENSLNIAVERKQELSEIDLDITNLDRTSIMLRIRSCYRMGYDKINIKFESQTTPHFRTGEELNILPIIHKEVGRLVGVEIIQQKKDFVVIKDYSASSIGDFDNTLRRIFLLTIDLSNDFLKAISSSDKVLMSSIEEKHDTISKFASYSLRLLNKKGYSELGKTSILYHIIDCVDMIVDIFKYAARDLANLKEMKLKKQTKEIIADIIQSLHWFYELFYRYDNNKVLQVNRNRDEVKIKINETMKDLTESENLLVMNLEHILEIIWDLVLARMSL